MVYTYNTPQANQQIATTQPLILGNFGFLQTGIGTEHNFNASGSGSDMYHLQASMPNLAGGDPSMLPVNTNGLYYVLGGVPKFYNSASGAQFIQLTPLVLNTYTGTITLSSTERALAVAPNSAGNYYLIPPYRTGANNACAMGSFVTSTSQICVGPISDPGIDVSSANPNNISFTTTLYPGTYTYVIVYWTP